MGRESNVPDSSVLSCVFPSAGTDPHVLLAQAFRISSSAPQRAQTSLQYQYPMSSCLHPGSKSMHKP